MVEGRKLWQYFGELHNREFIPTQGMKKSVLLFAGLSVRLTC